MAACHYELQRALTGKGADPQHRLSHLQTAREILAARLRDDPADDAARLLLSSSSWAPACCRTTSKSSLRRSNCFSRLDNRQNRFVIGRNAKGPWQDVTIV